jgi:hypothetical protein
MKATWNMALVALVLLGCVVAWSFAQQPELPRTPAPPGADARPPAAAPSAGGSYPAPPGFTVQAQGQNDEVHTIVEVSPDGKVMRTYRPGNAARYGGSSAGIYFGQQHDPETAKLYAAEEEAAKEAHGLSAKLKSITDEKEKGDATKALRDALTKQFEAQQKRRAHEISKIEERLGKLKDTMKKRESAKETIVGRRVDELTGVTDDLGWEETGVPARVRVVEPNYGPPGTSPVPVSPPRGFPGGAAEPRR